MLKFRCQIKSKAQISKMLGFSTLMFIGYLPACRQAGILTFGIKKK
jgi:hypothetical protein